MIFHRMIDVDSQQEFSMWICNDCFLDRPTKELEYMVEVDKSTDPFYQLECDHCKATS